MSFVWSEDVSPGASADAADMNEMQTNLDSIYTALGITRPGCVSGAGWTEFPITGGLVTEKLSAQAQQLRDVTDYAYDNKCPGYCSDEHTGYQSGDQVGVDAAHCPGYCSDEHSGYQSGYQAGVDATDYPGYYSGQDAVYQSGYQAGVDAAYCPGYCSDEHTGYMSGVLVGVDATYYPGYCSSYLAADYPEYYPEYFPAYYPVTYTKA